PRAVVLGFQDVEVLLFQHHASGQAGARVDASAGTPVGPGRLAPTDAVALQLGTGHRLQAQLLAGAAEGPAAVGILQAGLRPQDVEVALVVAGFRVPSARPGVLGYANADAEGAHR